MTCISPWNSTGGSTRAGVLVTPRHILFAAHYEISEGATVRFVTADGQVIDRTMVRRVRHPSYEPWYPDLTVGILNSDVSGSTPCKVLPTNYTTYLPTGPDRISALCLDQEEKAIVTDLQEFSSESGIYLARFRYPHLADEIVLFENKITGDSGNPAFLIINNELVLLTVWTGGGPGSGTFITPQIDAINNMIATSDSLVGTSTGYTLATASLSGFTSF
jgi:hypothetical protein